MARQIAAAPEQRLARQHAADEERAEQQASLLASLESLRQLPEAELRKLASMAVLRAFPEHSPIVGEQGVGEHLYLVLDGLARVTLHDKDGHEVLLGILGRSDMFGEGPLFGDYFRRASLAAESRCQLLQVRLDDLREHMAALPATAELLRLAYRARLITSTLGRVPLFSSLSPTERGHVAGLLRRRHFARGAAIVIEHETGDALYLIEDGQVTVEQGGQVIAHLDGGDFFGEMSLLSKRPHNATVRALTPVEALLLPGAAFHTLLEQQPALAAGLHATVAERRQAGELMRNDRLRVERLDTAVRHGMLRGSHLLVRNPDLCAPDCRMCEQACQQRHGHARLRVGEATIDGLNIIDACRQCRFGAECVEVCPADAFRWDDRGALQITDNCTGCGDCAPACPYHAVSIVPLPHTQQHSPLWRLYQAISTRRHQVISLDLVKPSRRADKCDLCHGFDDLACVSACPTGALRLVPVEELFPL